jgi:hypothetical protein
MAVMTDHPQKITFGEMREMVRPLRRRVGSSVMLMVVAVIACRSCDV